MVHDSYGWLFLPIIYIISSLYRLIASAWLSQLVLYFLKQLLKSYMFASYCDGWNLMRCWLLSAASMHKWTAQHQDLIHLTKSTTSYKWIVNSQPWVLCPPTIYLLRNWTELEKYWLDIQRVAQCRSVYFGDNMDISSGIIYNHSNIGVFFVLT